MDRNSAVIFASVGGQLPFPRLVSAVERAARDLGVLCFAQVGNDPSQYPNIQTDSFVPRARFLDLLQQAQVFVTHAGMGNLILASELGVPTVVVPRLRQLGEHRSDHQLATVRRLPIMQSLTVIDADVVGRPDAFSDVLRRVAATSVSRTKIVNSLAPALSGLVQDMLCKG